jgi:hypothetical protein
MWLGGLASMAVLLITVMAYYFAISYLNQYPAEKVGPSTFACDTTVRNAKFQSTLQARSVPLTDDEQPIFTMLDKQNFTLYLDFISTTIPCTKLSIYQVVESSTTLMKAVSCTSSNGILSASLFLHEHGIKIRIVLNDNKLIGAVRMGISGASLQSGVHTLHELSFRQIFYSVLSRTLSQRVTVKVDMTKVSISSSMFYSIARSFLCLGDQ